METLIEWKLRHVKTHADLDGRIEQTESKVTEIEKDHAELKGEVISTRPKALNKFALFVAVFGILITLLGGWWALSDKFNDRPTTSELKEYIQEVPNKTIDNKLDGLSKQQNDLIIILDRIDGRIRRIEEGMQTK